MRRASSCPVTTLTRTPVLLDTSSMNWPLLRASRTALVAAIRIRSNPLFRARVVRFFRTSTPRALDSADKRRWRNVPSPRRVMSLNRSRILYEPSGSASAKTMWMELVPMSITAIFDIVSPSVTLRFVSSY